MQFDLTLHNGRIVTNDQILQGDIGVRNGCIAAISDQLPEGKRSINANGRWVLPGGIDSHCHVEQLSGMGIMCADDFYSGTVSAAFGGTTTIIPFAAQHRHMSIPQVIADYAQKAAAKAVIDYGFHLILTSPDEAAMTTDLPNAIRNGITSFKVYMTYDMMKIDDAQILDVLALASQEGALVMIHAENHDIIKWIARKLLKYGHTAPKFHATAHDPIAEIEATHRAICLGRLIDTPIMIVHVSTAQTVDIIRHAQNLGAKVLAESCPQYLFLNINDLDRDSLEGAKFCCAPPPRTEADHEVIWQGLIDGTLTTYSSDHAPYRFNQTGKLPHGEQTHFREIANGVPGLELRMPLLFSEGVSAGRISIEQFVDLTATNHAKTYGLEHRKGSIAIGADADIAVWNPEKEVTITASMLHDNVGYSPYEGKTLKGWPEIVISRGRIVVENNQLCVQAGSGEFIPRKKPEFQFNLKPKAGKDIQTKGFFKGLIGL